MLWLSLIVRAVRFPSVRIISRTTKCNSVVFPSVPLTSESLSSVSSLNACAPPRKVPSFIRLPVLRTASSSLRKSRLSLNLLQATYKFSCETSVMNSRASTRLDAKGISTKTFRNLSAGPSLEGSPVCILSFSSSSVEGVAFRRVCRSSTGSSLPGNVITGMG